jgi:hypothetical protein
MKHLLIVSCLTVASVGSAALADTPPIDVVSTAPHVKRSDAGPVGLRLLAVPQGSWVRVTAVVTPRVALGPTVVRFTSRSCGDEGRAFREYEIPASATPEAYYRSTMLHAPGLKCRIAVEVRRAPAQRVATREAQGEVLASAVLD